MFSMPLHEKKKTPLDLASANDYLLVWGPVVWIRRIPAMKGIGILSGNA